MVARGTNREKKGGTFSPTLISAEETGWKLN